MKTIHQSRIFSRSIHILRFWSLLTICDFNIFEVLRFGPQKTANFRIPVRFGFRAKCSHYSQNIRNIWRILGLKLSRVRAAGPLDCTLAVFDTTLHAVSEPPRFSKIWEREAIYHESLIILSQKRVRILGMHGQIPFKCWFFPWEHKFYVHMSSAKWKGAGVPSIVLDLGWMLEDIPVSAAIGGFDSWNAFADIEFRDCMNACT